MFTGQVRVLRLINSGLMRQRVCGVWSQMGSGRNSRSIIGSLHRQYDRKFSTKQDLTKKEQLIYQMGSFFGHIDPDEMEVFKVPTVLDFSTYHVTSVSTCWLSSFLITDSDMAFSWGNNSFGQNGHTGNKNKVVKVPHWLRSIETLKPLQIATGRAHTAFLYGEKKVLCWGSMEFGQLGCGIIEEKMSEQPQKIVGPLAEEEVVQLAAGLDHTLALTSTGEVYGWGFNREAQLGLGQDEEDISVPTRIEGLPPIIKIFAGSDSGVALAESGEFYSWGAGESFQLGNGEADIKLIPHRVSIKGEKIIDLTIGTLSGIALTESGRVYSWGQGKTGVLGHGDPENIPKPKLIEALKGVRLVKVSLKGVHCLGLSEDGVLYGWGLAETFRLGTQDETNLFLPTPIPFFKGKEIHTFDTGLDHSLVVVSKDVK